MPNTFAAPRRDCPPSTALTTRSRKSCEYGRAMHAGPHPSMQLESQSADQRNPLSRFLQLGYRSSMETRDNAAIWSTRELDDIRLQRAAEMFADGISVRDVATEL